MCVNVDTAQTDDWCADKNEDQNDQNGDYDTGEFVACADLVALPVDVLWCRDLGVLYLQRPAIIQVLLLHVIHTAATHLPETRVQLRIKQVMIIVVT